MILDILKLHYSRQNDIRFNFFLNSIKHEWDQNIGKLRHWDMNTRKILIWTNKYILVPLSSTESSGIIFYEQPLVRACIRLKIHDIFCTEYWLPSVPMSLSEWYNTKKVPKNNSIEVNKKCASSTYDESMKAIMQKINVNETYTYTLTHVHI